MRIALIHALRHSPPPVERAFSELWPEAVLMNLLDDSLSADLARGGGLTPRMTERFLDLARYAVGTGARGILFTCSAFGPCIDAVKQAWPDIPVLKPNEAMIEEALLAGPSIGLMATFAPTLDSMPPEFPETVRLKTRFIAGAMAALDCGDGVEHDRLAAAAAADLKDCDAIALGQFSLARAAEAVAAATGRKVLTTPHSAVRKLRSLLA
jgi:Asp/Glu/hydantoin racemase